MGPRWIPSSVKGKIKWTFNKDIPVERMMVTMGPGWALWGAVIMIVISVLEKQQSHSRPVSVVQMCLFFS